jgi:protein involved in polysaccharide export with SLBB domain
MQRDCNAFVLRHGRFGLDRLLRFCEITNLEMKTRLWILLCCLISLPLSAQTTNLVDILRQYQADLDAKAAGLPTPAPTPTKIPPPTTPALAITNTPAPKPAPATNLTTQPTPSLPRLQVGDTLKIEVLGEPDMSADKLTINPDGSIRLPIAGPIQIANQTIPEAINSIRSLLAKDYLVDPKVRIWRTAIVESASSPPSENPLEIWPGVQPPTSSNTPEPSKPGTAFFTASDQVGKPGRYEWPANQTMTILRAIGMAGGATANADPAKAVIRRNIDGKTKDIPCDLRKLAWVSESEIPLLQNADEVILPRK